MTDYDLTEEEQAKVRQWLKERTPHLRCFCCGAGGWTVNPRVAMSSLWNPRSGRINYMEGYPVVVLQCDQCGHVLLFSAIAMGLKPEEKGNQEGAGS